MNTEKLLTPDEVAELLCVTTHTLAVWRCEQRYPLPYVKAGRLVRYKKSDVRAFIEDRTKSSTNHVAA